MKKMMFIVNPQAGQKRVNRFLPEIIRIFIEHGYQCETFVTGFSGEVHDMLAKDRRELDLMVCAGGDGTLNETIAGMIDANMVCPLGYIPCGTTNDYASTVGLSSDVLQAARDIVEGRPQTLDVGSFNGRYFVYTATCGAFAKASYTTSQAAKNMLGHMAYVFEGMRDLTAIKPIHMRFTANDLVLEDDFLFCSITNSTSVGGILKLDSQLVALNDGRFEITLVRNPINPAQLGSIFVGLSTQNVPNDMIHFFSAKKLCIESDAPVEWTLDGEREPQTDFVNMENMHSAFTMMVPNRSVSVPFENSEQEAEL